MIYLSFTEIANNRRAVRQESLEQIVLMLSPIMPHVCQELWEKLGHESAIMDEVLARS